MFIIKRINIYLSEIDICLSPLDPPSEFVSHSKIIANMKKGSSMQKGDYRQWLVMFPGRTLPAWPVSFMSLTQDAWLSLIVPIDAVYQDSIPGELISKWLSLLLVITLPSVHVWTLVNSSRKKKKKKEKKGYNRLPHPHGGI